MSDQTVYKPRCEQNNDSEQHESGHLKVDRDAYEALKCEAQEHETYSLALHLAYHLLARSMTAEQIEDLLSIGSQKALEIRCRLKELSASLDSHDTA